MNPETTLRIHARYTGSRQRLLMAASLGTALALAFATPSRAQTASDTPREAVQFRDLDVSHSAGAAVLYSRIRAAAERVCASHDGDGLDFGMRHRACINAAIAAAVKAVDQPALTAVHSNHAGAPRQVRLATLQRN